MGAIFKKMLSEDPQKRYEDIPTALKEIAKVRVVMSDIEEVVFKSYRRCLNNTDDFMDTFYENLFAHTDMQAQKPKEHEIERKRALQEKFYIDINMVFGVENFGNFVEKMATMQQGEVNPVSEYTIFLDAFIQTIEACDPRWDNSKDIGKAWANVRTNVLEQLKNTFPESETVSNFIPETVLNTAQIGKIVEKDVHQVAESTNLAPNGDPNLEEENMETTTRMETTFDANKA
jgi:hypothetical protein